MKINRFLWGMIAALAVIVSGCDDDDEENLGVPSISASESSLSFSQDGGATNAQTIVITSSRDWTASADEDWVIVSPTSGSAASGTTNVTVYVEANTSNDRTAKITFATSTVSTTVSVSQSGPDGEVETGSGTKSDPYTVAGALAIINAGTYTSSNVYVKGIISKIDEIDTSSYGNATYYISDDGTTTSHLEVFRGYSLGGVKFTSEDEIAVGDTVIVYGELTMYNTTPEITQGSSIYYLNGVTSDVGYDEDYTLVGSGTVDDPYTPEDANYLCQSETYTSDYVYVKGIISKITEVSTSYGNANYYISADGTETDEFYIYHGYGLGGAKFTSEDDIVVGDEVIVYGELTLYYSTAEMSAYSIIYSLNGDTSGSSSYDDEGTGSGTADDPYDVTAALYLTNNDLYTSDYVYVKGIISKISTVDTSYGNANYYISVDGTETDEFYIYRGYYLGNTKFTSEDQIAVGDEVIIYGVLTMYYSTPEMPSGNYIYSLNGVTSDVGYDEEYTLVGSGTVDDPYIPADANYLCQSETYTSDYVYVKGIISKISEVSTTYGNASYYISADGTETDEFYIYHGYGLGGAKFTSEDDLVVGDEVIVYGVLTLYYSTAEMSTYSIIYSLNGDTSGSGSGDDDDSGESEIVDAIASEINAAEDGGQYRITGYISSMASTTYGNYYLTDYSGTVYVYGTLDADGNSKNFSSLGINEGDIVTIYGEKSSYGDVQELVNVTVESFYSVTDLTIAEFNAAEEADDVYYRISGTVTSINNSSYGNLYIEDETGESVYIYGLLSGWGGGSKSFADLDPAIEVGDEITAVGIRDSYGSTIEMTSGFLVAHTQASGDEETTDVTWTLGSNAYDETSSSSVQSATVNGTAVTSLLKLGTSSKAGDATLTIPAGTASLSFYAVAWTGKTATLSLTVGEKTYEQEVAGNSGATGNPPYTMTVTDDDYYTITFDEALTAATDCPLTTTSNVRVILWDFVAN